MNKHVLQIPQSKIINMKSKDSYIVIYSKKWSHGSNSRFSKFLILGRNVELLKIALTWLMVADLFDTLYTKMYLIDKRSHDTVLVYEIFLKDFLYQCLLHVIQKKLFRKIFLIFFFKVMIAICLYFQVVLYHNIHFKI